MRDHDDGGLVLLGHGVQDAHHGQGAFAVQRGGGLIGQDHGRAIDQAPGNGHALLFATRELAWHGLGAVLHVQRGEQFQRLGAGRGIGHAGQHGQQGHVVDDVQKRYQVGRLKHKANLVAAQRPQVAHLPAAVVKNGFFPQRHAPAGGVNHGTQAFEQSAFAGT